MHLDSCRRSQAGFPEEHDQRTDLTPRLSFPGETNAGHSAGGTNCNRIHTEYMRGEVQSIGRVWLSVKGRTNRQSHTPAVRQTALKKRLLKTRRDAREVNASQ